MAKAQTQEQAHVFFQSRQIANKLLNSLKKWRASDSPLLKQTLLAYPEDQFYETHTQPQNALLALAQMFSSNAQAIHEARLAGASTDAFMYVDPENMSCLMATLARSMTAETTTVDHATTIRTMHKEIAED